MAHGNNSQTEASDGEYHTLRNVCRFTLADFEIGIPWSVLTHFDIGDLLKSHDMLVVQGNSDSDDVTLECKLEHFSKSTFDQLIHSMLCLQRIPFRTDLAEKLLIQEGIVQDNVLAYIGKVYGNRNVKVYRCTKSGHFYVCGKTQSDVTEATQVISKSIVEIVLTKMELEQVGQWSTRWAGTRQLTEYCSSDYASKFVATRDVLKDLEDNYKLAHFFKLPGIEALIMSDCGLIKEKVMEIAKNLPVTILPYKEQTDMLHLVGTKTHVTKFMSEIRKTCSQKEYTCSSSVSKIHLIDDEVKRVSTNYQCVVKIDVNVSDEHSAGAKLIANWEYEDGQKLHLVQGDLLKLNVDVVLLLTTTLGFPLGALGKESMEFVIKTTASFNDSKLQLGRALIIPSSQDTPCMLMLAVSTPYKEITEQLKEDVSKVFSDVLTGDRFKSVAIHASMTDEYSYIAPDFLELFVKAPKTSKRQCFICCTSSENVTSITNAVNQYYLLGQKLMCFRQIFAMDAHFKAGYPPFEIEVRRGSLIEQKVDVVVNTVNRKLDLRQGKISAMILEKGGESIQAECEKRCSGGLLEGRCVVTGSGDLHHEGIQHIIHCVLPMFQKSSFEKAINKMVKLCLLEADRHKCTSIAIPPIGTGRNKYPLRETMHAMMIAAKEYQSERVCSTLKTVVFVAPGDDYLQFKAVEEDIFSFDHIISKAMPAPSQLNVSKVDFPGLYQKLVVQGEDVYVHVTSQSTMKRLSASTVMFDVTDTKGMSCLHGREMKLSQFSNYTDAIKACEGKSVTTLALRLCNDTTELCMVAIRSIIDGIKTSGPYVYLQHVIIIVPNCIYDATADKLTGITTTTQRLTSMIFGPEWLPKKEHEIVARVTILGLSSEAVGECGTKINALMQGDLCHTIETDVDDEFVNISFKHNRNAEVSQTEVFEMSAMINKGIIQYLEETQRLDAWVKDVKTIFGLRVINDASDKKVAGTFDAVIEFEKYLINEFPRNPSKHKQTNSIISSDTRQFPSTPSNSVPTAHESKENDNYSYDFGVMNVELTIGDISQCNESCIVSPTHTYGDKKFGVSKSLYDRGGREYRALISEKREKLYPTECCVTKAGSLSCERVIHVCVPNFTSVDQETLLLLKSIMLNCFETACAYGYSSIAVPAIGTGKGSECVTIEHSAQQMARAIADISKSKTLINHIHIILQTKEHLEVFNEWIETVDKQSAENVSITPVQITDVKVHFQQGIECDIDTLIAHDVGHISIKSYADFMKNSNSANVMQLKGCIETRLKHVLSCDLPIWNPELHDDICIFGRRVQQISKSIFKNVIQNKWRSVGVPLFGKSVDEQRYQSPMRQSSASIVRGLMTALKKKGKAKFDIYIISDNVAHLKIFKDILRRELLPLKHCIDK